MNARDGLRLLLDHNVPAPLRDVLPGHETATAAELGWDELANGRLIAAAAASGFDAMVTADRNIVHQQNLVDCPIGIVVLSTNQWPVIRSHLHRITAGIAQVEQGRVVYVDLPRPPLARRPPPGREKT